MSRLNKSHHKLPKEMLHYYESGNEINRLAIGVGQLEIERTKDILQRYLPPPPAVIFDVGGGTGIYSLWLARLGYEVHLIDVASLHIERAKHAMQDQPDFPLASLAVCDARKINRADSSVDAVLLFGPLYHLTERNDRITVLREAYRIVKPGGLVFAVGISRFASTLDGLFQGYFDDPEFVCIAQQDLKNGQHRNSTDNPLYFTTEPEE